ncbi:hypothetical protein GCM10010326_11770 [Streptomyces xanthochromogenes]|uniref:Uncharacterized protein n=1 Tax=Streptomyces xanthochromogenes TaxID=67384 RepID=A0ABQ2ZRG0_9ACTN|nr:hypothetical protein GCM10010326_11770 [Streptomyces xanthochromogenes]
MEADAVGAAGGAAVSRAGAVWLTAVAFAGGSREASRGGGSLATERARIVATGRVGRLHVATQPSRRNAMLKA